MPNAGHMEGVLVQSQHSNKGPLYRPPAYPWGIQRISALCQQRGVPAVLQQLLCMCSQDTLECRPTPMMPKPFLVVDRAIQPSSVSRASADCLASMLSCRRACDACEACG